MSIWIKVAATCGLVMVTSAIISVYGEEEASWIQVASSRLFHASTAVLVTDGVVWVLWNIWGH
jgi:hypothetical protein